MEVREKETSRMEFRARERAKDVITKYKAKSKASAEEKVQAQSEERDGENVREGIR